MDFGACHSMKTFWLSMHRRYACRHSGACCSAGWPIPIEQQRAQAVLNAGTTAEDVWLVPHPEAPADIAGVLALRDGHCIFHRGAPAPSAAPSAPAVFAPIAPEVPALEHGCAIQSALGPAAMPSACEHFPRQVLLDARGVFVTLSHYCPTAASLLFECTGGIDIVEGPPAVGTGHPEGLDARDTLPPLLTPDVLMDLDGYTAWERHMVRCFAGRESIASGQRPEQALARLTRDAAILSRWRPGVGSLVAAIQSLEQTPCDDGGSREPDWPLVERLFETARATSGPPHGWPAGFADADVHWRRFVSERWPLHAGVVNRFLAAHAFAAWVAYQGDGLLSMVRRLALVLAVLTVETARACGNAGVPLTVELLTSGVRQTDLLLVHLADRAEVARRLSTGPKLAPRPEGGA
jgi:hypothetical protein